MKLYAELSDWWPVLSPPSEYEEEAAFYAQTLLASLAVGQARARPTALELGSGGGNNALHMKAHFDLTLVDPSPGMLAHSRRINPECEHIAGDMRTLRLERVFDAVFIHDAICYMTDDNALRRAVATAFVHCRPGGAALFAPDYTRETFRPSTDCGGIDAEGRGMRYLEWSSDPDPFDSTYVVDYAFLLREADGSVRVEHDRHVEGLFGRDVWLRILADEGFDAERVPFKHSELDDPIDVFLGRRL